MNSKPEFFLGKLSRKICWSFCPLTNKDFEFLIIIRVKYLRPSCGLKILFFAPCTSFHITDGTSFMAKDGDGTSVQKLTEVHISTLKKPIRVLWPN
jgi:hypothetical protein